MHTASSDKSHLKASNAHELHAFSQSFHSTKRTVKSLDQLRVLCIIFFLVVERIHIKLNKTLQFSKAENVMHSEMNIIDYKLRIEDFYMMKVPKISKYFYGLTFFSLWEFE